MRRLLFSVVVALAGAAALAAGADREPFVPRLVRLEAASALPEMSDLLAGESVALNAVLLEYAPDPALRLGAHLALLRYPTMAREILPLFGGEPEFREVLAGYGPAVLPPIAYFLHNEVRSLRVMRAAGDAIAGAKRLALTLWGEPAADDAVTAPPGADAASAGGEPSPVERGWYAIAFIRDEGHDFLGQFVVGADGDVEWVQTERITEAAAAFFAGGIRALETRYRLDLEPGADDYLWAGVDVALIAGAGKALTIGRAAATGARATVVSASASMAARGVVRAGRIALRTSRYVLPLAVTYAVVRHPSLLSSLAAQVADRFGWPVPAVQGVAWFVVLLPLLVLAGVVMRVLIPPSLLVLRAAIGAAVWLERQTRPHRRARPRARERIEPRLGDPSRLADTRGERAIER